MQKIEVNISNGLEVLNEKVIGTLGQNHFHDLKWPSHRNFFERVRIFSGKINQLFLYKKSCSLQVKLFALCIIVF